MWNKLQIEFSALFFIYFNDAEQDMNIKIHRKCTNPNFMKMEFLHIIIQVN